jgi:hypothetical protein
MLTIDALRYNNGPSPEAHMIARDMETGSSFLIIRKGPLCLMRYDACEYEVKEMMGVRVPWLKWVTFAFTRREVLRKLERAKRKHPDGH